MGGAFGLVEGVDEAVAEGDGECADGDFDVDGGGGEAAGILDDDAAVGGFVGLEGEDDLGAGGDEGRLRDEVVFDVFPDLLGAFLAGAVGAFLGFAEAALDFGHGHAEGDFVAGDEGLDFDAALLGLAEVFDESVGQAFDGGGFDPCRDAALAGVAAHAEHAVGGDGLDLDGLGEAEFAGEAGAGGVEVAGGRGPEGEPQGFQFEVGEINRAGLSDDGRGREDVRDEQKTGHDEQREDHAITVPEGREKTNRFACGRFSLNADGGNLSNRAHFMSIQDYVVQGGQSLTAGEIDAFRRQIPLHKLKAETLEAEGQGPLREQVSFLLRYIEDVLDGEWEAQDIVALPEAVFAVRYLAKGVDIIPDNVAGGYMDDALVVRSVLGGHAEEFVAYAKANGLEAGFVTK